MSEQFHQVDVIHQDFKKPEDLLNRKNIVIPYYKQPIVVETQGDIPIKDVFERVVFKLTHSTTGQAKEIANLSSLPLEFVEMIQAKLIQAGLLNSGVAPSLTPEGLKKLGLLHDYEPQKVTLWCLRNALTSELVPFFSDTEPPVFSGMLNREKGFLRFLNTEKNRSISASGVGLRRVNSCGELSPEELQRSYRKYEQICLKNAHKSRLFTQPLTLASLNFSPQVPELVYILCEIHAFEGRTDFLVTNGLGSGYSDSHLDYLKKFESALLGKFREDTDIEDRSQSDTSQNDKITYNSNYYDLHKLLHNTYKKLIKLEQEVTSDIGHNQYLNAKQDVIKGVYDGYELALYMLSEIYPIKSVKTGLKNSPPFKHACRRIQKVVKKLGFKWQDSCKEVLAAKAGQIIHFTETKSIQAGLAIAVMSTTRGEHPFENVAEKHPLLLHHLSRLKMLRDQVNHGKQIPQTCTNQALETSFKELIAVISLMFPGENFNIEASKQRNIFKENIKAQKVTQTLEKALGHSLIDQLSSVSKRNLEAAIELNMDQKEQSQSAYVTKLANALQDILFISCRNARQFSSGEALSAKEVLVRVKTKLRQVDLLDRDAPLPSNLHYTSKHRIIMAWEGRNSTLGANFLAFIAYQDLICLKQLKDRVPQVIQFVSNLIEIRAHGQTEASWNEISQEIPETTYLKLIKTIMEL